MQTYPDKSFNSKVSDPFTDETAFFSQLKHPDIFVQNKIQSDEPRPNGSTFSWYLLCMYTCEGKYNAMTGF